MQTVQTATAPNLLIKEWTI